MLLDFLPAIVSIVFLAAVFLCACVVDLRRNRCITDAQQDQTTVEAAVAKVTDDEAVLR